jgi:hypothetical protein
MLEPNLKAAEGGASRNARSGLVLEQAVGAGSFPGGRERPEPCSFAELGERQVREQRVPPLQGLQPQRIHRVRPDGAHQLEERREM